EEFYKRVHPDDQERVWTVMEAAIEPTNPRPYAIEYRLRRGDGGGRWVEAPAVAYFGGRGGGGRGVGMVGTGQGIAKGKQGEEARKHHEELLQRQADLLNQSHDAILTVRTDGSGIVYWSGGAERLYGYTAAEAQGRRERELLKTRGTIPIEDLLAQLAR